jgi:hypothetical protein
MLHPHTQEYYTTACTFKVALITLLLILNLFSGIRTAIFILPTKRSKNVHTSIAAMANIAQSIKTFRFELMKKHMGGMCEWANERMDSGKDAKIDRSKINLRSECRCDITLATEVFHWRK